MSFETIHLYGIELYHNPNTHVKTTVTATVTQRFSCITVLIYYCAAVGASALESANTVGYQEKAITDGVYNYMAATFDRVDAGSYTLADIGVNDGFIYSTLSFLADDGSTKSFEIDGLDADAFSYYFTADLIGTSFEDQPGWYYVDGDGDLHSANSIPVPYGSIFYVEGMEDGAAIRFAGAVATDDIPVDITDGVYNYTGNCTPVDLTLGDIQVNDSFVYSTVSFLNDDGSTKSFQIDGLDADAFSYYFAADLIGTSFEDQPGWYYVDGDGDLHNANNIAINSGETFYVEGMEDGAQVIIPSAL